MRTLSPDITERATLAEFLLDAIVDASDDAIITQSLAGAIVTWNAGAERIYGYPPDAMFGRSISRLVPPGMHDLMPGVMGRIQQGEDVVRYNTLHLTREGVTIDVSVTV